MIASLLEQLDIPAGRILFLHARLKHLQIQTGSSYYSLTHELLAQLQLKFSPLTILVPAYTPYTFMTGGVYHRQFSRSEVGRFSEEVRLHFAHYRTPDPMFSILDVSHYLENLQGIDYQRMQGENSLMSHLYEQNSVIINIDMAGFWSTHVHWAEQMAGIPYRSEKNYEGVIYHDTKHWEPVRYTAFIRDFNMAWASYPAYNQQRRQNYLMQHAPLQTTTDKNGLTISWMSSQTFVQAISNALSDDPNFLIETPDTP